MSSRSEGRRAQVAFQVFFRSFNLDWMLPIICVLIIVDSLGGASAWILGPARGLLIATQDSQLPKIISLKNKKHMPVGILILQGLIVTALSCVFLIMPSVNSSYWILSNLTAQLALIFYVLLFAAAIRLRYKHKHVKRAYRIPGKSWGIWVVCGIGILTCLGAIILGFLPPSQIAVGNIWRYEAILIFGILTCFLLPIFLYRKY